MMRTKATLGSIFHQLLERHYGNPSFDAEDIFKGVEARWRDRVMEAGGDLQQMEGILAQAYPLFLGYAAHYRKKDADKEWLQLEGVFDVQWNDYRLRGRCDGLYRDKSGKVWLLETKTKSRISEDTMTCALNFDPQNLFYILAKEQETGLSISGVLYNVIRQPSLKQKQSETKEDFFDRIGKDIAERSDHYFMRYEVKYTERQKREHRAELICKLKEFEAWCGGKMPTYKSECSCQRGWACEYLEACATGKLVGYNQDGVLFSELLED